MKVQMYLVSRILTARQNILPIVPCFPAISNVSYLSRGWETLKNYESRGSHHMRLRSGPCTAVFLR